MFLVVDGAADLAEEGDEEPERANGLLGSGVILMGVW